MSVSQGYSFNNAANFTLSSTQISGSVGKLALISNVGQNFTQNFASDTGFTYTASLAEFTAGLVRQKNQVTNTAMAANYNTNMDLLWRTDVGGLTALLNGVPTLVSNKLRCVGAQGVSYDAQTYGQGTIKFLYTPNYTGLPPSNVDLVNRSSPTDVSNMVALSHSPSGGTFRVFIKDSTSTNVLWAQTIGANPSFVSGTEYEIEFSWDNVAGIIRVFIGGDIHGTVSTTPWSSTVISNGIYIGAANTLYNTANGTFDDVVYYDNVQHTVSYTPVYTIPTNFYLESRVTAPTFSYIGAGSILAITSIAAAEIGAPKYIINNTYWNGSAWIASNGTYAQANTIAEINTNIGAIAINPSSVDFSLVFPSSNTLSSVDNFEITYIGEKHSALGYFEPILPISAQSIESYLDSVVNTANTNLKIILKIDGILTYWDGAAWSVSDASEAQSNTKAEINANLSSLSLGANASVHIRWLLATTSDTDSPEISTSSIIYDFGGVATTVDTCTIYGYLKNISNTPLLGVTVNFKLDVESVEKYSEAKNRVVSTKTVPATTDINGYFEIILIRSSEYEVPIDYRVTFDLGDRVIIGKKLADKLTITVPDSDTKDITDLLPMIA